jgi:NADH:ubiquinone oxidoreductase subunit D
MKEEVRQILSQAVETTASKAINKGLGSRIHNHFARIGGVELELPTRSDTPSAPELNP